MPLWIPRDIFINGSTPPKINSLLSYGAAAQIQGIESLLGVSIDHYVRVRFRGFERIVDALGGVRMFVHYPTRDDFSGLSIALPGCTRFDGALALSWARSRHYEQYIDGRWTTVDPVPDIGRIQRQQQLLEAIAMQARRDLRGHPRALLHVVDTAIREVQVDSGLDREGIVALTQALLGLTPDALQSVTMPWTTTPLTPAGEQGLRIDTGSGFSASDYLTKGPSVVHQSLVNACK